ncbi:reverse transcriptase [Artemisia annua]|uniref:Reverse transcriptase n=1 Tax=Artemisia annua TaxID=35608 RepID=A0A2U1PEY7_ARTAN|nr:reverse transcriptase [Artemisia annua]
MVEDCYMINIYGPHDPVDKVTLWNKIWDIMQSRRGKYMLFGHMNEVRDEQECYRSNFSRSLSKLDQFLLSEDVLNALPDIRDHNPILLHCKKSDSDPVPFKIYNSWFLREGFDDVIPSEWANIGQNTVGNKLVSHEKLKILKLDPVRNRFPRTGSRTGVEKSGSKPVLGVENSNRVGTCGFSRNRDWFFQEPDRESLIKLLQEADNLENLEAMDTVQ